MATGKTISEHKVLTVHKCIKVAKNGKPSHCHSQCKLCFVAIVLLPVNSALFFFLTVTTPLVQAQPSTEATENHLERCHK